MELQKSLLETWNLFSRFFNTLTADDKYSVINRDYWMHTIQIHLSQKEKIFSQFFSAFFESALNSEHFQKKSIFIAYITPKLPTTKNVLRQMSKSSRFREPVDRRHGKWAEALIQY